MADIALMSMAEPFIWAPILRVQINVTSFIWPLSSVGVEPIISNCNIVNGEFDVKTIGDVANAYAAWCFSGYLWVYIDEQFNVVFDFTPDRSWAGPIKFLGQYSGYVQADAYSGYDEFFRVTDATEVGCNTYARRKFEYALDSDPVRAARLMVLWGRLYEIERIAREGNYDEAQLLEIRQTQAQPIFSEIKPLLEEYKNQVLPKSPMGKAVGYALNQWDALLRYTDDPQLDIDNNHASYCTSLSRLQTTSLHFRLSDSFCPGLFTGGFSPGCS